MLQDLPPPVLGLIVRSSAVRPHGVDWSSYGQLASINLACRATHEALPLAFSPLPSEVPGDAAAAEEPSAAFYEEAESDLGSSRRSKLLVLQLDLDRLGTAAFCAPPAERAASVRRSGQRFAQASALRLQLWKPIGVHGAALFAEHFLPRLPAVQHLFVDGPRDFALPPFWQVPGAAGFAATVHELTIKAHQCGLVNLAQQLRLAFPALTGLSLDVRTGRAGRDWSIQPQDYSAHLTVDAPAGLRVLLVSAHEAPDESPKGWPFALAVSGMTTSLHTLRLLTWHDARCKEDEWLPARPLRITGQFPALRDLDVSASPWHAERPEGTPVDALWRGLHGMCPALTRLVMRRTAVTDLIDERSWVRVLDVLAPLSGSLQRVEAWTRDGGPAPPIGRAAWAAVQRRAARVLPRAQLVRREEREWDDLSPQYLAQFK